jgi:hypothetical protein
MMACEVKKRFIAGAVCPRCGEMDKIVMYKKDESEYRECVGCGFQDKMHFKQNPQELETRVNMTEAQKIEETQVLTLNPHASSKKH